MDIVCNIYNIYIYSMLSSIIMVIFYIIAIIICQEIWVVTIKCLI